MFQVVASWGGLVICPKEACMSAFPHFVSLLFSEGPALWKGRAHFQGVTRSRMDSLFRGYYRIRRGQISFVNEEEEEEVVALLLLLLLLLLYITFVHSIYNYTPETSNVFRVYNVAAIL
jgi:hypothetical protein